MDLWGIELIRRIINALNREINNKGSGSSTRNSRAGALKRGNQGPHDKSWVSSYTFLRTEKVPQHMPLARRQGRGWGAGRMPTGTPFDVSPLPQVRTLQHRKSVSQRFPYNVSVGACVYP